MQREDFVRPLKVGDGRRVDHVSLDALAGAAAPLSPRLPFSLGG